METINQDIYSIILETLPIDAINSLRIANFNLTSKSIVTRQDDLF